MSVLLVPIPIIIDLLVDFEIAQTETEAYLYDGCMNVKVVSKQEACIVPSVKEMEWPMSLVRLTQHNTSLLFSAFSVGPISFALFV